jgi:small nuclear ribonucleoprotein (snRNP)-like protein
MAQVPAASALSGGLDNLVGKRVACVLTTGERIEGSLCGFDSQFNVSLRDVRTSSIYDPNGGTPGSPAVKASIVRGSNVMYVEVCE